jgi:2-methylisocitrate lyase-like PEP mutase family enzyme
MSPSTVQQAKAEDLRRLHHGDRPLVLANVWDVASARIVEAAGYPAIATSSAGVAWSLGYADGERISRAEMLEIVAGIANAVALPVTADLENGYGADAAAVTKTVDGLIAAGGVGLNLEDSDGHRAHAVYDFDHAVAQVRAARAAADAAGVAVVVNARTDVFFPANRQQIPDPLAEAVRRGNAYLDAGADCVFTPLAAKPEVIEALVRELQGPLNILAGPGAPSIAELAALGVKRVSIGGAFSRMAYAAVRRAAAQLRDAGTYGFMDGDISHVELNALLDG